MKRYYLLIGFLFTLILSIVLLNSPIRASDIQLGGQLNASMTGFYDSELGYGYIPQASLDMELYVPRWDNNEIKCAGNLYTDITEAKVGFFWKRLYWKHRFENLHLTIGRQPISWSFGSLLNPVDYSLGAVALDEEYSAKYQNAVEAYFPINWHTSLSLVASLSDNSNNLKVGLRGRTLINDFDVMIHFVQENIIANEPALQRFGITTKGDVGKFGVYGALGYYGEETDSFSLLAGLDYSYFFQAGNQLYLQMEYLNLPPQLLSQITGSMMSGQNEREKNIHLLVGNISYQIDEFSSMGMTSFCNFSDGSKLFMSTYRDQINTNTNIEIQAGMMMKVIEESNSFSLKSLFGETTRLFVELGINYAF
jgi:hypothetical protein